jgi:uncharacterized protein YbjT (DUF2867 family)
MTAIKTQTVIVAGASGEHGRSIMAALLDSLDLFEPIALARAGSENKECYKEFACRGAKVAVVDYENVDALTKAVTGIDVVIDCLSRMSKLAEENLMNASIAAGVGRYVPSFFGIPSPPRGVLIIRDQKEDMLDRIRHAYQPFTVIDIGWWYQNCMPLLLSGRWDDLVTIPVTKIIGDGNVRTALTDVADVGKYVARIIADPRTLNRFVFAYNEVTTFNKLWDLIEELSGEKLPREYEPKEELEAFIAEQKRLLKENPSDLEPFLHLTMSEYKHIVGVRSDNTPESADYLGYMNAKELYPDVKFTTIRNYIQGLLDGTRNANLYAERPDHPVMAYTQFLKA